MNQKLRRKMRQVIHETVIHLNDNELASAFTFMKKLYEESEYMQTDDSEFKEDPD